MHGFPAAYILSFLLSGIVFTQNVSGAGEADRNMKYADALYDAQEFGFAKQEYLKIAHLLPPGELAAQAQYKVGECLQRQGNYWFAVQEWGKVIKKYPASPAAQEAKKQIEYAEILLGNTEPPYQSMKEKLALQYIYWGDEELSRAKTWPNYMFRSETHFNAAMDWYEKVARLLPGTELAARAQCRKGDLCLYVTNQDNYEKYSGSMREGTEKYLRMGLGEYNVAIASCPNTFWADKARILVGDFYRDNMRDKKSALAAYQAVVDASRGKQKNSYFVEYAKTQIDYLNREFDAESEFVRISMGDWEMPRYSIQDEVANKCVTWGNIFKDRSVTSGDVGPIYKKEELETAIFWYDLAMKNAKGSEYAAKAQFYKGEAYYRQDQATDYNKAVEEYKKVIADYPKTHWADEAGMKLGDTYINKLREKSSAVKAYRDLVVRRNFDEKNYYVSYALAQIKYLEGDLDIIEKEKKKLESK